MALLRSFRVLCVLFWFWCVCPLRFNAKSPGSYEPGLLLCIVKRLRVFGRPCSDLLSQVLRLSTIGAEEFDGRVRDGIGSWAPRKNHKVSEKHVS